MDKSVAEKSEMVNLPDSMEEATSNLAQNLLQSEPFLRYKEAERKFQADLDSVQLLTESSELQQKIRAQQYSGFIEEADIARLRELQIAIGLNDTIQEHGYAQEIATTFLREVNQEISNLLGVDFASLARRSGGCC